MAEYVYIQNYTKKGTLGISRVVFDQIVSIVTNKVQGVRIQPNSDKFIFTFHKPVRCEIRNGKVLVSIQVRVAKEAKVSMVCSTIQEEVANALTSMTELVPFSVNIKVTSVE